MVMKSWHKGPDNILLDAVRVVTLMSFCFGVGLFAYSIIGVGLGIQSAETVTALSGTSYSTTSTAGGTDSTVTQTPNDSPSSGSTNIVTPSLSFISSPPSIVTSDFTVTLNAVAIYRPQLVVRGLNVNKTLVLDPASQTLPTINFLVKFNLLLPGRYELIAKGFIQPDGTPIEVAGSRFEILAPVLVTPNYTTSTESQTVASTSSSLDTASGSTTQSGEVEVPKLDIVLLEQAVYKGFVPVKVRTSVSLPEVFIYLQSPNFSTPKFVGKARYYDHSTLLLMVDTNQLPNGEHRIYARVKLTDVSVESEKLRFVIDNPTIATTVVGTSTNPVATSPITDTAIQPKVITEPVAQPKPVPVEPVNLIPKTVYEAPKTPSSEVDSRSDPDERNIKKVVLSDELKVIIPLVLKKFEQKINQRLKTFGDDLHVEEADVSKLRKKAEEDLMSLILSDYRLHSISPEAKKRLRSEVERLVLRAEKVELLIIKSEVTSESLDELLKTLESASSSVGEALVDTSSPREFGLVREDIMKIESVSPVISVGSESTSTNVYTEIRGRAVPNSLVTLYIYSTPVMVTVRADKDGTFVYVYEKDLEGGDHEVYVALTTTEGEVVVKSPGFQFVREAEAFNSPDSENGDILTPYSGGMSLTKNPYSVAIAVTLLVLSFLLFGLSFRIRKNPDDIVA